MKARISLLILLILGILASGCTTTLGPGEGTGYLILQITDKPSLGIEKVEVTISRIQVHKVPEGNESGETGWITVANGPHTLDLVAIKDIKEILGKDALAAGIYTQIRLDIESAKVTIDGTEHDLSIPHKTVMLVRSFEIVEMETTILTLDFDAERSVHLAGASGEYIMKPTIRIIQE
ncbi:MAG: DUF4382 domain-containing protein [Candidatus Aenigmatarchaeota archaeon]|nr:MAG: DUF4382 domain-containing protein [Candidatus Aenigmarchaeota archaeon]